MDKIHIITISGNNQCSFFFINNKTHTHTVFQHYYLCFMVCIFSYPFHGHIRVKNTPFFSKITDFETLNTGPRGPALWSKKTPLFRVFVPTHAYNFICEWPPRGGDRPQPRFIDLKPMNKVGDWSETDTFFGGGSNLHTHYYVNELICIIIGQSKNCLLLMFKTIWLGFLILFSRNDLELVSAHPKSQQSILRVHVWIKGACFNNNNFFLLPW